LTSHPQSPFDAVNFEPWKENSHGHDFLRKLPECGMGPLHHEWRHLRGIAYTMWSYVYPLLNEQVEKFCYCPSHNIPLGGGESQIQVADPRGQLDY